MEEKAGSLYYFLLKTTGNYKKFMLQKQLDEKCMCLKKQQCYCVTWLGMHQITAGFKNKISNDLLTRLLMTPQGLGGSVTAFFSEELGAPAQPQKCAEPPPLGAGPSAAGVSGTPSGTDESCVQVSVWEWNLESGDNWGPRLGHYEGQAMQPIFLIRYSQYRMDASSQKDFTTNSPKVANGRS